MTSIATGSNKKNVIKERSLLFDGVVYVVMLFVLVVCLVPFLYIVAMSFSSSDAILNNKVWLWPVDFTLEAYQEIIDYPNFFVAYGNTLIYAGLGTLISLTMMVLFAYPLSKSFLRGQNIVMKLVVFSMFFSGGLIPNYLLVSSLKLTGTRFAMLLPFAINQFNLIILINFFRALPGEIEEAALIDGLSWIGILIKIVLPLSGAALATVGLYTAVFFWNDWFYGLIYLNASQYPVMLLLRNIVKGATAVAEAGGVGDNASIAIAVKSAVIITSTLPIILLYPFLQKYFVKGMTVGAVKG